MSDKKVQKSRKNNARLTNSISGIDVYYGRDKAVSDLLNIVGTHRDRGVLIQSIEGPGGIGKTALFEHVLAKVDRTDLKQLTMKISGVAGSQRDPFELVRNLVTSCETSIVVKKPIAQQFSTTEEVCSVYGYLLAEARKEFECADSQLSVDTLMQLLRISVSLGRRINDFSPKSKEFIDFAGVDKSLPEAEETIRTLKPLLDEIPGVLDECVHPIRWHSNQVS
jgi:hypothetical protein